MLDGAIRDAVASSAAPKTSDNFTPRKIALDKIVGMVVRLLFGRLVPILLFLGSRRLHSTTFAVRSYVATSLVCTDYRSSAETRRRSDDLRSGARRPSQAKRASLTDTDDTGQKRTTACRPDEESKSSRVESVESLDCHLLALISRQLKNHFVLMLQLRCLPCGARGGGKPRAKPGKPHCDSKRRRTRENRSNIAIPTQTSFPTTS